jgi:hypothetical protein
MTSKFAPAPAYGVYISQLIRYSRACGSYQDFLDWGLLLTRKLLNQGLLLVKLKSSLQKFYDPGRVSNSCSNSDTRRVNLVTIQVISHEWGKDREVFATSRTYPWSFVTVCFVDRCLSFCTFVWSLCCLFFFDVRILITPLVSSNSSYLFVVLGWYYLCWKFYCVIIKVRRELSLYNILSSSMENSLWHWMKYYIMISI